MLILFCFELLKLSLLLLLIKYFKFAKALLKYMEKEKKLSFIDFKKVILHRIIIFHNNLENNGAWYMAEKQKQSKAQYLKKLSGTPLLLEVDALSELIRLHGNEKKTIFPERKCLKSVTAPSAGHRICLSYCVTVPEPKYRRKKIPKKCGIRLQSVGIRR